MATVVVVVVVAACTRKTSPLVASSSLSSSLLLLLLLLLAWLLAVAKYAVWRPFTLENMSASNSFWLSAIPVLRVWQKRRCNNARPKGRSGSEESTWFLLAAMRARLRRVAGMAWE
jgi:hypothetical protein